MKTVNYYPVAQPGPAMWSQFDPVTIGRDMLVAKGLGFQALRVFIPVSGKQWPGTFDMPTPAPVQLAKLTQLCTLAKQTGMRLHLSLFDWWGSQGFTGQSKQWVTSIASAVDKSVLAVVELQNETPFGSTAPYAGGGEGAQPTVGATMLNWAKQMVPFLRVLFPGIPVTVSCNGLPEANLLPAVKALGSLPDGYDWHVYPSTCPDLVTLTRAIVAVAPKLLRVGEYGCPSITADGKASEQGQHDWMAVALSTLRAAGIEPAPWCLYDYSAGWAGQQASYGLLSGNGRIKPAALLYATN